MSKEKEFYASDYFILRFTWSKRVVTEKNVEHNLKVFYFNSVECNRQLIAYCLSTNLALTALSGIVTPQTNGSTFSASGG